MTSTPRLCDPVVVLKLGGSVLTGLSAYRRAAEFIARRLREEAGVRLLVVVSAEHGQTDALLQTAREITSEPDCATLDLLWSTGELRSVALLVFSLHAIGVAAACANVHQTGLVKFVECAKRAAGVEAGFHELVKSKMEFATRTIHAEQPSEPGTGALVAPIFQTST